MLVSVRKNDSVVALTHVVILGKSGLDKLLHSLLSPEKQRAVQL
jgi:hypothetical protein